MPPQVPDRQLSRPVAAPGRWPRRVVAASLILTGILTFGYTAISIYYAFTAVYKPQKPLVGTPADFGLSYGDVTFPAREDHVLLRGWFIPGVLPNGQLTTHRAIVIVHGRQANRTDPSIKLLDLSAAFARRGFAVLAFDMRGNGQSPPALLSYGYFEQRDVLGAVDFLRLGSLPYPELGRPRVIAGWGISTGASTLLLAAAREPAIRAVVADTAFADLRALLEREVERQSPVPVSIAPGIVLATRVLFGFDYYAVRPVDVVASIAPRSLLFIHGDHDDFVSPHNLDLLVHAANTTANAHVMSWLVPGVTQHAASFKMLGEAYINFVVAFYTTALGPDAGATA